MSRCLTACLMMLAAVLPMRGQVRYDVTHVGPNVNTIGSETGAVLVSGGSPSLFRMVISQEASPEQFMRSVLESERYRPISA